MEEYIDLRNIISAILVIIIVAFAKWTILPPWQFISRKISMWWKGRLTKKKLFAELDTLRTEIKNLTLQGSEQTKFIQRMDIPSTIEKIHEKIDTIENDLKFNIQNVKEIRELPDIQRALAVRIARILSERTPPSII